MKEVIIHCDGASRGNGRTDSLGAYGAVIEFEDGIRKELNEAFRNVTNNQMELMGAIKSLELIEPCGECEVSIYSDSKYVCDAFNKGWIPSWKNKGWVTSKKTPVLNRELWERLDALVEKHDVSFIWVKGHSSNEGNIRADQLCNIAMDNYEPTCEEVAITCEYKREAERELLLIEIEHIKSAIDSMTKLYEIKTKRLREL